LDANEKEGLRAGPALLPVGLKCRGKQKKIGGLGSSHTAPCGAAVPARPPTRSSETTHLDCTSQWVPRATRRSTWVVVQKSLFSNTNWRHKIIKSFYFYKLDIGRVLIPGCSRPNSTTPRAHRIPAFRALLAPKRARLKERFPFVAAIRLAQPAKIPLASIYSIPLLTV
jgi:hypothetical protein